MLESPSKDKPLIQDSEYNVLRQLEKKADFLYSAMKSIFEMQKKQQAGTCKAVEYDKGR
jgi:hypothetical protein